MSGTINAFEMAQSQFDCVARLLKIDPQICEVLRWPAREFLFRIPVRMDDGSLRVFTGFRVQHNDDRGPKKSGIAAARLAMAGAGWSTISSLVWGELLNGLVYVCIGSVSDTCSLPVLRS
jgi:hypothetical protein